jgi:YVTN family beta-propeller protein
VLTASDATQYAFEGSTIHGEATESVFTRHLVAGLRDGSADLDHDGDITLDELYSYVYERVIAEQPNQRPKRLDNVEGRTIIAANVNWALPSYLEAAITSSIGADRLVAVESLGQLLRANNEAVRRTARARLEVLAQDNSNEVVAAAQARLDAPELPPPVASSEGTRAIRSYGQDAVTIRGALRASARRWRARIVSPPLPVVVGLLSALAALTLTAGVVLGFADGYWETAYTWYLTAAAAAAVISFGFVLRRGLAFTAGLLIPALVGGLWLASWHADWIHPAGDGNLEVPIVWLSAVGQALWIAAAVVSVIHLRRANGLAIRWTWPAGRHEWISLGLGVAATIALLVIVIDQIYHSGRPVFRGVVTRFDGWPGVLWTVLSILVVELALVGPLAAVLVKGLRPLFLGGWMLGATVCWLGVFRTEDGFASPAAAVAVLAAAWLLLAGLLVVDSRRDRPIEEAQELGRRRWALVGALVLPVLLIGTYQAAGSSAPRAPQEPLFLSLAMNQDGTILYGGDVTNDTVVRIDTLSRQRIGKPLEVGLDPFDFVLAPKHQRMYVANARSNSVSVVDLANWKVVGEQIPVAEQPSRLALSPDENTLFVLSSNSNTMTVVDTQTAKAVGAPVGVGADPRELLVAEGKIFVSPNSDGRTVTVLDAHTRQPIGAPLRLDKATGPLIMGTDKRLYGAAQGGVVVIDTSKATPTVSTKPVDITASRSALSSDGRFLYTLKSTGSAATARNQLVTIDTLSWQATQSLNVDWDGLASIVVSPDGFRIYATSVFGDGIDTIDTTSNKSIGTIKIPG